jgi:hypothetical protein
MSCSKCGTKNPEPTDTWQTESELEEPTPVYWFLVSNGEPVEMAGIEEGGEIAFRFRACETLEHPIPEDGERVLCGECFSEEFPPTEDDDEEEGREV